MVDLVGITNFKTIKIASINHVMGLLQFKKIQIQVMEFEKLFIPILTDAITW